MSVERMAEINCSMLAAAAALVLAPCAASALGIDPNTKAALVTLEKSAYDAWKSKDAKFWDLFLSDRFVGWGSSKLDKTSAAKEYTGADCDIKSYALSDEQISPLGENAALITHKTAVDGACGGQKIPLSWTASLYVREGDKWKAIFHAQSAVVDPNAIVPIPARKQGPAKSTARDSQTDAILAVERDVWEAWREHDAKKIAVLTAKDISFINIFGTYLATKADALQNWSGAGCDVKSVSLTDAAATLLSPTVGILTFNATADGTCFGQKVGPVWGSSIYVKHGDSWKWTFGINVPARS
jgi:ketosteroid isomerase-like protein